VLYLIDTNILSPFRKKRQHPALAAWVNSVGWRELATTVVTLAEIQCGAERARKTAPEVAEDVDAWIDRMLADGHPQIVPMGVHASRLLGKMHETPSLRVFTITQPTAKDAATGADLAIAAIAISEGGILTTNNVGHFMQIHAEFPLPGLFDPMSGAWHVLPFDGIPPS
jgi:predicted nucleic acid-binding protein